MAKASFTIEWPDECGEAWMNEDNLMVCLNAYCKGVDLKVVALADALVLVVYNDRMLTLDEVKELMK